MKLNKVRHFIFVNDSKSFAEKKDIAIFRGKIGSPGYDSFKELRYRLLKTHFGNPMCDLGEIASRHANPQWLVEKMTINQQLDYKFILAIEGNDVASNLKWIMSSNSVAVMPRPTCETWFMEGTLIPNIHYIEVKPAFSDLEQRLNYYINHQEEALKIIENAHKYVDQFRDNNRENLISLLVLDRYFKFTNPQDIR